METASELQSQEITALKSIYADDFVSVPPPKAWKGALRLHEFMINVRYPIPEHETKVWFGLHVKFPKTYPSLATPTFTIQKPTHGLNLAQVNKLTSLINTEAQKAKGAEMVFQIVTFAQEWMSDNVSPPVETSSLAIEMNKRAVNEEKVRQEQLAELERLEAERAQRAADALSEQIRADAEARRIRNRQRASSSATEVPRSRHPSNRRRQRRRRRDSSVLRIGGTGAAGLNADEYDDDDDYSDDDDDYDDDYEDGGDEDEDDGGRGVEVEKFEREVEVDGVRFECVRLLMPRREGFETVYAADPVFKTRGRDESTVLAAGDSSGGAAVRPLEAHVVKFDAAYYSSTLGRKKLKQVETELQKLATIRHPNLINVYAVKLYFTTVTSQSLLHPVSLPPTPPPHESISGTMGDRNRTPSGSKPSSLTHSNLHAHMQAMSMSASTSAIPTSSHPHPISLANRKPTTRQQGRLVILTEAFPTFTLASLLAELDGMRMREDRVSAYLAQILGALNVVHAADLVHRGIGAMCIGLAPVGGPWCGSGDGDGGGMSMSDSLATLRGAPTGRKSSQSHHPQQQHQHAPSTKTRQVKLGRVGYWTRLLDLHRSNAFEGDVDMDTYPPLFGASPYAGTPYGSYGAIGAGMGGGAGGEFGERRRMSLGLGPGEALRGPGSGMGYEGEGESEVPETWRSKEAIDSPLSYTRSRDLHALGVVLLRMLLGADVTDRFDDGFEALNLCGEEMSAVLYRQAWAMLSSGNRSSLSGSTLNGTVVGGKYAEQPVSCISLLGDLADGSFRAASIGSGSSGVMVRSGLSDPRTPTPASHHHGHHHTHHGPHQHGQHHHNQHHHHNGTHAHGTSTQPTQRSHYQGFQIGSPEIDYFRGAMAARQRHAQTRTSRWKEDWEELELLGKGAFGSVVKARNKVDNRVYAVKKIRLKAVQNDKIYREINALSRLNHRFIVRYYTTWVETSEDTGSAAASDDDDSSYSDASSVMTSVPIHSDGSSSIRSGSSTSTTSKSASTTSAGRSGSTTSEKEASRGSFTSSTASAAVINFSVVDLRELDEERSGNSVATGGGSGTSFPSIHFSTTEGDTDDETESETETDEDDEDDGEGDDEDGDGVLVRKVSGSGAIDVPNSRTLIPGKRGKEDKRGKHHRRRNGEEDVFSEDDLFEGLGGGTNGFGLGSGLAVPMMTRTMYIQMEFVERQTLKERIEEGITEDEAWRLFQQIVDALVHIGARGILHRDIKPTNIFIDVQGDVKVGDFGLATSSLAAVDPSDVAPHAVVFDEMTLEVGTRLYIAPEVQSRRRGPRNHSKADLYSLGIVFFEMNYMFSTGAERIAVIEDLRKPSIFFPSSWEPKRERQRKIITSLLQHSPDDRPSASELAESPLLPARVEDEHFKGSLKTMVKQDSVHHQALLSALFSEPPKAVRAFLYDAEADNHPEQASLNDVIHDRLSAIFRLHGAIDMEPPLMIPLNNIEEEKGHATFIDRHGDLVFLPRDNLVPFARLAARSGHQRIKRYHISNIYKPNSVTGHPKVSKAAVFDIITPDMELGLIASGAEILTMIDELLNSFPGLSTNYEVHISHSSIVDIALQRIPIHLRAYALDIMNQTKSSPSQKRANLVKRGLPRSTADEMEILSSSEEDIDFLLARIEKISPSYAASIAPAVKEIKETLVYAGYAGLTRPVYFRPLMLGSFYSHFKDGVLVEVVRKNKRMDILAAGGRYDNLISRFSVKAKAEPTCALALQISVEKLTSALIDHQRTSVPMLIKEQKSFGYWSPRRCDVYVVSYHRGSLQERLEVVSHLWSHGISADLMYESALEANLKGVDGDYLEACQKEGILFAVVPRAKTARRDQAAFKVKSILKGTETEVPRHELVAWLQQQISEQKRIDALTSGAPNFSEHHYAHSPTVGISGGQRDVVGSTNVQLLLPGDVKKQRKQVKQLFLDRAFETSESIKSSFPSLPVIAVDVPPATFHSMTLSSTWLTDEDQWRPILASFALGQGAYAQQIREAVLKKRSEGLKYLLLFAVREERMQLLTL